jgi:hypothetical protein
MFYKLGGFRFSIWSYSGSDREKKAFQDESAIQGPDYAVASAKWEE